jgi:coenzyme PQQ biosynthesis protein PqqD
LKRPRLAAKAMLRLDRQSGRLVLVYPERGLLLNATAGAIAARCTGDHDVAEIVDELARRFPRVARASLEADVHAFLENLERRGLLREEA